MLNNNHAWINSIDSPQLENRFSTSHEQGKWSTTAFIVWKWIFSKTLAKADWYEGEVSFIVSLTFIIICGIWDWNKCGNVENFNLIFRIFLENIDRNNSWHAFYHNHTWHHQFLVIKFLMAMKPLLPFLSILSPRLIQTCWFFFKYEHVQSSLCCRQLCQLFISI